MTPSAASNADIEILTVDNLQDKMTKIANSLQETIKKPLPICWALLQENRWACDSTALKYVKDGYKIPAKFCGAYNPEDPQDSDPKERYSSKGKCILCDDEHIALQGLNCSHLFCAECWDAYIRQKVVGENTCVIQCPETKCTILLDRFTAFRLCKDENIQAQFKRQEAQRYVMCTANIKPCPGIGCNLYSLTQVWSESSRVVCNCGNIYCSDCGHSWHEPVNCELLAIWMRSITSDHKNLSWIHSNTKPCPKCKVPIEKNKGCNHMSCTTPACLYQFCWICLGDWKLHTAGSPYKCNRFEGNGDMAKNIDSTLNKEQRDKMLSKLGAERFIFFAGRFANHEQSLKFEHKFRQQLKEKMKQYQTRSKGSFLEAAFIKEAVDALGTARRILQYSYALAYFLKSESASTLMFVDNQQYVEFPTEEISDILEKSDINKMNENELKELKTNVVAITTRLKTSYKTLLNHAYDGAKKKEWEYCEDLMGDLISGTMEL